VATGGVSANKRNSICTAIGADRNGTSFQIVLNIGDGHGVGGSLLVFQRPLLKSAINLLEICDAAVAGWEDTHAFVAQWETCSGKNCRNYNNGPNQPNANFFHGGNVSLSPRYFKVKSDAELRLLAAKEQHLSIEQTLHLDGRI
jgi:hypothetical protein